MKRNVLGLLLGGILIGVALGALVLWINQRPSEPLETSAALESDQSSRGLPFADFALESLDGKTVKLSQFRGRSVIVNFWATWCTPCKEEMPLLQKAYTQYPDKLVVIGVNAQEDPIIVKPFVEEHQLTFPIVLDPKGEAEKKYTVRGFPTSFFIDSDGVLQAQHIGELDQNQLSGYLKLIGVNE